MEQEKDDSVTSKYSGLKKQLSDAGSYSYAAICAISLNDLYGTEYDLPYSKECIKKFVKHLQLPKQVFETMDSLVSGYGSQSYQAYVELLMAEPAVKSNPILVIQDLVLFAIETGHYDARSRVLVMHVASLLGAPQALAQLAEENLGHSLLSSAKQEVTPLSVEQQELADKKQRRRKFKRYALIGLATVGGGALLGVTGGLAAPLIGAGIGTIIGGGAAAAAIGSVAGAAIVGSLFGLAGAGLTGYRMKRRVGEIEEFEFGRLSESEEQLHIAIAVSGWLNETDDNFSEPWQSLNTSREQYYLRYESTYLRELGNAMDILVTAFMSSAVKEMLKHTVLRGLLAAIAWPASLLSLSHIIDNPWGTCLRRSAQVGRHLAEVLLTRQHGGRPVTLVGFSLGARVIYYCLRELADRMPGSEGIIQDAVMLGAPVTGSTKDWTDISSVVAGKIVNGYCRTDWLLKFLYRTTSVQVTIAGLNPIECVSKRVHNVDLTDHVSGHQEYIHQIDMLLKIVGVRTSEHNVKRSMSVGVVSGENHAVLASSRSLPADLTIAGQQMSESLPILEEQEEQKSTSTWFVSNQTSDLKVSEVSILEKTEEDSVENKKSTSTWFVCDQNLAISNIKSNVDDGQSIVNHDQCSVLNNQDTGQLTANVGHSNVLNEQLEELRLVDEKAEIAEEEEIEEALSAEESEEEKIYNKEVK